ncbi:hypothetical protein ABZX40_06435 [Streptomyces sp. NPDC004610]|uniref:hypothetical protein n=1 Tax=unclassified Streptomyces TaxID=2593676 RepID=UPI0033B40C91
MRRTLAAREVVGPDEVTFSEVWISGAFLLFGVVVFALNAQHIRKSEVDRVRKGCVLAFVASLYLAMTLLVTAWTLVHAIRNS